MRLHSDVLTTADVRDAARRHGVNLERNGAHGSHKRRGAVDFILSSDDQTMPMGAFGGQYRSASWDAWGLVLAELFRRDPDAIVTGAYLSAAHFHWSTAGRFDGRAFIAHKRHRWAYVGEPYANACKCGAVRRFGAYDAAVSA